MKNAFFVVFLTVSTVVVSSDNSVSDSSINNAAARVGSMAKNVAVGTKEAAIGAKDAVVSTVTPYASAAKGAAVGAKDAVVSTVALYVPQPLVNAKNSVAGKFAQLKNWAFPQPVVEEKSRFSKVWNATVFGYEGAGKYVVVSTAAAAAIVAAYAAYCFAQPTLEDQVIALVNKAQANPNVVLQELPGILAQCSSDDARIEILHYVLSQVVITPEIAAAFNLQQ